MGEEAMSENVRKLTRTVCLCGSLVVLFQNGCITKKIDTILSVKGVRFDGVNVQERIMSSVIVRQKYTPLQGENGGKFTVSEKEIWWREDTNGTKMPIQGADRLEGIGGVFYPMYGTNGWIGVDFSNTRTVIPVLNDIAGKRMLIRVSSEVYTDELRVAKKFFSRVNLPMSPEEEEKTFDPFLFDGNKRLIYRTFNPHEQYFEYDAMSETLEQATTNRVSEIKRTFNDIYRIPVAPFKYWKQDKNCELSPDFTRYRPLDPVKDAVPLWLPEVSPSGQIGADSSR